MVLLQQLMDISKFTLVLGKGGYMHRRIGKAIISHWARIWQEAFLGSLKVTDSVKALIQRD
jgi:hypothetical protein